MSKAKELILVLVAIALAMLFLSRQGGKIEDPVEPIASASPQATPVSSPSSPLSQEQARDLKLAEGMFGYTEVSQLSVPPSTPETLARGKEIYSANCVLCHGENLAGDGPGGQYLDPPPTDLRNPKAYKYGHLEPAIYRSAMYGIEGTGMAPWEGILTVDEVWDVTHYVRSMQMTEKPEASR